jgi:hypothetical protein
VSERKECHCAKARLSQCKQLVRICTYKEWAHQSFLTTGRFNAAMNGNSALQNQRNKKESVSANIMVVYCMLRQKLPMRRAIPLRLIELVQHYTLLEDSISENCQKILLL